MAVISCHRRLYFNKCTSFRRKVRMPLNSIWAMGDCRHFFTGKLQRIGVQNSALSYRHSHKGLWAGKRSAYSHSGQAVPVRLVLNTNNVSVALLPYLIC
ncbi:hypothetical protein GDO81_007136 [Engystomops pustulosus]|uniref:Uncharacterized protein n=1 Tax=Engystomops pustulosus TaxID=76066 RepID=A0AAV7C615_ENGPU|nr:hypothetical protein GDO81_007136 [Engystomops pustulosus]